jgi:hypothetical protein
MCIILLLRRQKSGIIMVQSHPWANSSETLSKKKKKNTLQKRAGGVAQGLDPEFKPQYP